MALAGALPPATAKQRDWAYANCFQPIAVYKPRKREVKCLCCGHTTIWEKSQLATMIDSDEYWCPQCGKSMSMQRYSESSEMRSHRHFTILTTFKGWQVARTFEVSRCNYRTGPARYSLDEVYQTWIDGKGGEIITGRPHRRSAFYLTWDFHKPWEIKRHNAGSSGYFQYDDIFDITGNYFYPRVRVTPLIKRNGWKRGLMRYERMISMIDAMRWLLTIPTAEMLVKTGQWDMFLWMVRRGNRQMPFLHSVRIANRNGYIVTDTQLWLDMLEMASDLGMDTHNPKVVCPDDLKHAHDSLLAHVAKRRSKIEREKNLREAALHEDSYVREKGAYFGIRLSDEDLSIKVISSVSEMAEEGETMHHCVFTRQYFKNRDSLILSARDVHGNRLETVELSLRNFKVLQSRAAFNRTSPFHERIIRLVESNADKFKSVS